MRLIIISPNLNSVWISELFAFNFVSILPAIFFAKAKADVGIALASETAFFGIIIVCPFEIGLISNTAIESVFSSIILLGISFSTINRKIPFDEEFDF